MRLEFRGLPEIIETLTKDIGLGGLRCILPNPIPVATPVVLELVVGPGQEPLSLPGRAAWFRMLPQSEQAELGIVFEDLPVETRRRLSTFFDRLAQQPAPIPA